MARPRLPDSARNTAIAAGETYYHAPCTRPGSNHTGKRRTKDGHCIECVRESSVRLQADKERVDIVNAQRRLRRQAERQAKIASGEIVPKKPGGQKPGRKPGAGQTHVSVSLDGETLPLGDACQKLQVELKQAYARQARHKIGYQAVIDWYAARRDDPSLGRRVKGLRPRQPRDEAGRTANGRTKYLLNEELIRAIAESKGKGRVTEELGSMIALLAKRFFKRHNYYRYSYVDEMQDEAMLVMLGAAFKFDPEKSQNPFSYLTTVMRNVANRILMREKQLRETVAEQRVVLDSDMEQSAPGSRSRGDAR